MVFRGCHKKTRGPDAPENFIFGRDFYGQAWIQGSAFWDFYGFFEWGDAGDSSGSGQWDDSVGYACGIDVADVCGPFSAVSDFLTPKSRAVRYGRSSVAGLADVF